MRSLDDDVRDILYAAHQRPFSLQSDLARAQALPVAIAASTGLLSCLDPRSNEPHARWFITLAGLKYLTEEPKKGEQYVLRF